MTPGDRVDRPRTARSGSRRKRPLVVLVTVAAAAAVGFGLLKFANASSAPRQIAYQGRMYMGVVEVTRLEATANFGRLHRSVGSIDGKPVFVSPGRPPAAVALLLSDKHFNAYQLMR